MGTPHAAVSPPSLCRSAITYDVGRGVVLLFGGARQKSNDVAATNCWALGGTPCSKLTPAHLPRPPLTGTNHLYGFDSETRAVVFDGSHDDATQMTAQRRPFTFRPR